MPRGLTQETQHFLATGEYDAVHRSWPGRQCPRELVRSTDPRSDGLASPFQSLMAPLTLFPLGKVIVRQCSKVLCPRDLHRSLCVFDNSSVIIVAILTQLRGINKEPMQLNVQFGRFREFTAKSRDDARMLGEGEPPRKQ